jgi:hypothetical protein
VAVTSSRVPSLFSVLDPPILQKFWLAAEMGSADLENNDALRVDWRFLVPQSRPDNSLITFSFSASIDDADHLLSPELVACCSALRSRLLPS